jgi:hypothetical protein
LNICALQFIASHVGPCLAKERCMYRIFVKKVKPTVQMPEKSKEFRQWHSICNKNCTGHNWIIGNGSVIIDRDYTTLFPNNLFKIYVLIEDLFTLTKTAFRNWGLICIFAEYLCLQIICRTTIKITNKMQIYRLIYYS